MIDAALMLARHVGPVFPTRNGRPCCAHGVKDASRDPARIRALWARAPGANISVAMGAGLIGLDVDMKNGPRGERNGIASLARLEATHGPLPLTPHYATPSGGRGYLFAHPGVASRFDFRPGLELHGAGAAMTLPPSQKNGQPYVWITTPAGAPFAPPPAWLLAAARPPPPPRPRPRPLPRDPVRTARYAERALERECATLAAMGRSTGRNNQLFVASAKLGRLIAAGLLPRHVAERALADAAQACGLAGEDGWRSVLATIRSGLDRQA